MARPACPWRLTESTLSHEVDNRRPTAQATEDEMTEWFPTRLNAGCRGGAMFGCKPISARIRRIAVVLLVAAVMIPAISGTADAAAGAALTRYPYLTDSI